MWRCVLLAMLGLCLITASTLADETLRKGKCLPPEHFQNLGRLPEFLPHASAYLAQNVNDPQGPRIALDMFMVATALQDADALSEARRYLLLQYTDSIPADYVIRATKKEDLRTFLTSTFTSKKWELNQIRVQQYSRAVRKCLSIHGPEWANDELWAQAALCAPDHVSSAAYCSHIREGDGDSSKLTDIAFDTALTTCQKYVLLQGLSNSNTAQSWQRYLFNEELTESERNLPEVERVVIVNLVSGNKFKEALKALTQYPKISTEPQMLYCRGIAEAATERVTPAIETLTEVIKKHPRSPWAKSAKELSTVLATHDSNLKQQLACLEEMCDDFSSNPPEVLELELLWGETPEKQFEAMLGLDFVENGIEFVIGRDGHSLAGYSSDSTGASYFVPGDENIYHFLYKGVTPSLEATASLTPQGSYIFNCDLQFDANPNGARKSIENLLSSPIFENSEARKRFVRFQLTQGMFPQHVVSKNGERCCRWLHPQADKPEMKSMEVRFTQKGHLLSLECSNVGRVYNIRYGSREELSLTKRKWPSLPIIKGKEMGPAEMFRLIGAVSELFYSNDAAPKTAVNPQPIRR